MYGLRVAELRKDTDIDTFLSHCTVVIGHRPKRIPAAFIDTIRLNRA